MKPHIVIIGAGYAGMMTALRLSHTIRKHDNATITLINGSDVFVERIRLHQLATNRPPKRRPIERMLRGTGVHFVQGWVQQIHAEDHSLTVQTEQGEQMLRYDRLVYAPGSATDRSAVPGIDPYAYTLDLEAAQKLQQRLPQIAEMGGTVTVIGGGLTGIEAATEIAERYPALHIQVMTANRLGEGYARAAQTILRQRYMALGITLHEGVTVQALTESGVQLSQGETIPSDAVVWAGGFGVPRLAQNSGMVVNGLGQLWIDSNMRSLSHANVYGVGDAAAFSPESGLPRLRMTCAVAMPMGAHLADNLAAELNNREPQPFAFSYAITCISLGQQYGLAMLMKADGQPMDTLYAGRLGGFIKNLILRYTVWSLQLERRMAFFRWPRGMQAHASQPVMQSAEKALTDYGRI